MRSAHLVSAALGLLLVSFLAACHQGLNSARASGNERSAIAQLRTIGQAQAAFLANHSHFACTLPELGSQFGFIDKELIYGEKDGYYYYIQCFPRDGVPAYQVWASPKSHWITRHNYFCTDESGAVRNASHRKDDCSQAVPVE